MTAAIALDGVSKSFGRSAILRDVSFAVERGEIVGLLGPNGSGKTTTLRIIAGFIAADHGMVRLAGAPILPDSRELRRRIGYLPERPPLYEALTVDEYLDFVAAAKGLARRQRREAIAAMRAAFRLEEARGKPIRRLSKGFRQRVGLAQAMIGDPEILLLDEATNGLDPLQAIETRELIRKSGAGRAVLFSSHLMQEVAALCSRVVILCDGRVVDAAPPDPAEDAGVVELDLAGIDAEAGTALLAALPGIAAVLPRPGSEKGTLTFRCLAAPGAEIRDAAARAALGKARLLGLRAHLPRSLEETFVASLAQARAAGERPEGRR